MNLDCKISRKPKYAPPTSGWGYYVQRWGTRDRLKAQTEEAAIAEAKEMPGAQAVVLVEMRTVWMKSGKISKGGKANTKSVTRGLSE